MPSGSRSDRFYSLRNTRFLPVLGFLTGVAVFTVLTFFLWGRTNQNLEESSYSANDNSIWMVTQLEIEFLRLQNAIEVVINEAEASDQAIRDMRRRFDIYYSRLDILTGKEFYLADRYPARALEILSLLKQKNEELVPLIDGSNAALRASTPEVAKQFNVISPLVRELSNRSVSVVVDLGQTARVEMVVLLRQLSFAVLGMFVCLGGLAIVLFRISQTSRQRSRQIRQESTRFSTVISTSPDALLVTDAFGRIIEFNRAAELLFSTSRAEVLNKRLHSFLETADRHMVRLPFAKSGRVSGINQMLVLNDQTRIPVDVSQGVATLEDQVLYVYFLRDVTERVAADAALKLSRDRALAGDRAKSRFLAVMSHEMRTPLNGILGLTQLMKDNQPMQVEDRQNYVSMLENSAEVLLEHVNEVLDIAELESDGVRLSDAAFDLDALLRSVMGPQLVAAQKNGVTLTLTKSPISLGWFMGDEGRLRQVIVNLVSNAIKFTGEGEVSISVTGFDVGTAKKIEMHVADTGIGISEDDQTRVFDDFVRLDAGDAHREGTGLGLGIAKRIVKAMGGEIGVDSILGEGSLFWFDVLLPVAKPAPRHIVSDTSDAKIDPKLILIVEDNKTNRFVLREMLERDGHRIVEAANGLEAVVAVREDDFDLILMDVNMPVMGGLEATQKIRRENPNEDLLIYALTAHTFEQSSQTLSDAGLNGVLSKPLKRDDLRALLAGKIVKQTPLNHQTQLLDLVHLNQVFHTLGPDRSGELISGFVEEVQSLLSMLKDPTGHNIPKIEVLAHSVSGTAAMIGVQKIRNVLNGLEGELQSGSDVDLGAEADLLQSLWNETHAMLNDALKDGRASTA